MFSVQLHKIFKKRIEKLYLKCYNIQKQNERNEDDLLNTKKIFMAVLGTLTAVQIGTVMVSAVNTDRNIMQNDYLNLYIGQDTDNFGRYQLSANKGDLENSLDDGKNLMYENFYSSYSTVVVNGKSYHFGEGETVTAPYYDSDRNVCITVQKFGDVEVTQTLKFADGMKTGHEDMLFIGYSAKNTGAEDVLLGFRIMIDSQLDKDDKCTLYVDSAMLDFEKEYKDSIPQQWSVVSSDGNITAYGKINTIPDSIIFADWSSLFDKKWDYRAESAKDINDCAAALVWNNQIISSKETNEYSVYYGVKNLPSAKPEGSDDSVVSDSPSQHSNSPQTSTVSQLSVVLPDKETPVTGDNGGLTTVAAVGAVISLPVIAAFSCMRRKARFRQRNED